MSSNGKKVVHSILCPGEINGSYMQIILQCLICCDGMTCLSCFTLHFLKNLIDVNMLLSYILIGYDVLTKFVCLLFP